jgi:hypothetical protein
MHQRQQAINQKVYFSYLLLLYLVLSYSACLCCSEEKSIQVCLMRQGITPFLVSLHIFVHNNSNCTKFEF